MGLKAAANPQPAVFPQRCKVFDRHVVHSRIGDRCHSAKLFQRDDRICHLGSQLGAKLTALSPNLTD